MAIENVFLEETKSKLVERINKLNPASQGLWGKMNVAQMLAHCNVTYEMVYEKGKHPKPNLIAKFFIKTFVKKLVVGESTYAKNSRTAPQFIIANEREFEAEKARLIAFIEKTQALGEKHFEGLESHSFGPLNAKEWNNMFYKHLDHHLQQFGV
ncbi:MAG: DUF1569 domain-containing protein [Chitinophagales bacterium]|nr:DUF1569 domain-containing protein [Bacteroidota bacterium]MCB9257502.1 DUF1569 domain-containing protein [Chitinophagales bacterium]